MELHEYQPRAEETAHPRAYHLEYLIPGICGEIGELFGRKAKGYWHGWSEEKLQEELVSEYGDIAWMTALLLKHYGVSTIDVMVSGEGWEGQDNWENLLIIAGSLWGDVTNDAALALWTRLEAYCLQITGVHFGYVLEKNLEKLASRAERGTLVGEGNHR